MRSPLMKCRASLAPRDAATSPAPPTIGPRNKFWVEIASVYKDTCHSRAVTANTPPLARIGNTYFCISGRAVKAAIELESLRIGASEGGDVGSLKDVNK